MVNLSRSYRRTRTTRSKRGSTLTPDEIKTLVAEAVDDAMAKSSITISNGRNTATPKTFVEFLWQAAQTFGVPAAAFGVILLIIYQTFPAWVQASIETQNSLSRNLDLQTENIKSLGVTLDALQVYATETAKFRKDVEIEHKTMGAEMHEIKLVTDTLLQEQARQRDEHKAIVDTLKLLCEQLQKPSS